MGELKTADDCIWANSQVNNALLNCVCQATAPVRATGEEFFPCRSRAQRRSPIVVRGRLLELRRRARPCLPLVTVPVQHDGSHLVGLHLVRRRPHHISKLILKLNPAPHGHFADAYGRTHVRRNILHEMPPYAIRDQSFDAAGKKLFQAPRQLGAEFRTPAR